MRELQAGWWLVQMTAQARTYQKTQDIASDARHHQTGYDFSMILASYGAAKKRFDSWCVL